MRRRRWGIWGEPAVSWVPLSKDELLGLITSAQERMTPDQRCLWGAIRIPPEKWAQHPYGELGGGFWAVGLLGRTVVWYNDIEEGFNCSEYTVYGTIGTYWCDQDGLEVTIRRLLARTKVSIGG